MYVVLTWSLILQCCYKGDVVNSFNLSWFLLHFYTKLIDWSQNWWWNDDVDNMMWLMMFSQLCTNSHLAESRRVYVVCPFVGRVQDGAAETATSGSVTKSYIDRLTKNDNYTLRVELQQKHTGNKQWRLKEYKVGNINLPEFEPAKNFGTGLYTSNSSKDYETRDSLFSSCSQVVQDYLQPRRRNSLKKCAQ